MQSSPITCSKFVGKKGLTRHRLLTPSHTFICFELAVPPLVIKCSLWEIQKQRNSLGCAALPAADAEAGAGDEAELLPFLTQQNEGMSWRKEAEHTNTNVFFF